jgi:hypothetical protein
MFNRQDLSYVSPEHKLLLSIVLNKLWWPYKAGAVLDP